MIPPFETFLYPSLLAFEDGNVRHINEIRDFNAAYLQLSEDDKKEQLESGSRSKLEDRTSFSITYLYQAGLIERPKRACYKITKEGSSLLQKGLNKITKKYLEQNYSCFYDFVYNRKKVKQIPSSQEKVETSTDVQTPQDQMENAYQMMSSDLASQLLDEVKSNTPQFFERLVIRLLVAMGYGGSEKDAAEVTRYSHDDGIDGVIKEDKLGLDSIYIQAKRYTVGSVPKPDMQKFIGALSEQGASKGIFITTSTFSNGAIETSKKAANVKIVLIDGQHLADYMIQYNIGVSVKQVYEIKKIDSDFFSEE